MCKLIFILRKIDDNTLALKLHWGFRLVFGLLAVIILSSMLVTSSEEGGSLVMVVLIALFVLIALYNESWYFSLPEGDTDRESTPGGSKPKGLVRHFHGLVMLAAHSSFSIEDIESIEVKAFRKGSVPGAESEKKRFFQRDLLTLSLIFTKGGKKDIEITEAKNKTALQRKAAAISDFTGISYHSEV